MKKYLVIGNPINHSLSPKIHNHWIKENNINANYNKKQINEEDIGKIIIDLKKEEVSGINVTIPFKKKIIPFLDKLTNIAEKTKSVNTIYKENDKIVGHNTDAGGFELALNHIKYNTKNKKILILGAGGVVSSIIFTLEKMKASKIVLSNRTKKKAEDLKIQYPNLKIIDWGKIIDFDMIINATSVGLNSKDEINLNYNEIGSNKFFYDVIYSPSKTNFLLKAKKFGNKIENGKMMFIYQAQLAFKVWHNVLPKINDKLIN